MLFSSEIGGRKRNENYGHALLIEKQEKKEKKLKKRHEKKKKNVEKKEQNKKKKYADVSLD